VDRWIVCAVDDPRASSVEDLAAQVEKVTGQTATPGAGPEESFAMAEQFSGDGGRLVSYCWPRIAVAWSILS
jgi:hypothetical protein